MEHHPQQHQPQHQYRSNEFIAATSPPTVAANESQADERRKLVTACINTKGQGVGNWDKKEVLGRGAFGIVWRGVLHSNGTNIAVKQIHTDGLGEGELKVSSKNKNKQPAIHCSIIPCDTMLYIVRIVRHAHHIVVVLAY